MLSLPPGRRHRVGTFSHAEDPKKTSATALVGKAPRSRPAHLSFAAGFASGCGNERMCSEPADPKIWIGQVDPPVHHMAKGQGAGRLNQLTIYRLPSRSK